MPDTESDKTGFPNLLWYKALYFDKISVTEKRVKPRMKFSYLDGFKMHCNTNWLMHATNSPTISSEV
jgi:hypothetical protein